MNITVNIAEIQKARLKKGYSQRELARKAGVSTLAVNYMEQQKTVPRPKTLQKICSSLDLSITDICEINA